MHSVIYCRLAPKNGALLVAPHASEFRLTSIRGQVFSVAALPHRTPCQQSFGRNLFRCLLADQYLQMLY